MVFNVDAMGALLGDFFTNQLFGNEILVGISVLIVGLIFMFRFQIGFEGILVLFLGYIFVFTDLGDGYIDVIFKFLILIFVAVMFTGGLIKKVQDVR